MSGYSGTPLASKLGYKSGMRACVLNAPDHYQALVAPLPDNVVFLSEPGTELDLIHLFVIERTELQSLLPRLEEAIARDGMIWVSWPKKASMVPTTVTEDVIRDVALKGDLVDVKVCAVDDVWSGLKLVIRRDRR
ncbi:DUF3052 domain-containing protein [Pelagibius sp. Alg239-R121]|uniref:DUF3052 domain-containing protein n=1 Tax=Pelagibius sp. Alg239-R121 TaxID=2993448 RepID=UPI0024A6AB03|nr:DUF3052 domain-containing protein [Pelagibius sp. Alg239-R121]